MKNCQILAKKIGWYDAVFRLSQEAHQIPLVNLERNRRASRSKCRSRSPVLAIWRPIAKGFPTTCSRATISTMKKLPNTCEKFVAAIMRRDAAFRLG